MIQLSISQSELGDCFAVTLQYTYQQLRNTPETPRNHNYIEIYIYPYLMYTYTSNYHYLFSYFNLQISLILQGSILALIYVPVCFFMNVNFSFGPFSIKEFILKKTHTQKKINAITLKRLKKLNVAQISIIKNYPWGKIGYIQFMN